MDRKELAAFLRGRRERIRPADVGVEAGPRRRTPGLRREEVARLAGMSVDYYIRLEQGRGPHPSRQILTALARALRLNDDEVRYLHDLAGERAEPPPGPPQDVPPGILHLLERMDDTPAYVMDAKYEVLAWNALAAALVADFATMPQVERNAIRWLFEAAPDGEGLTADMMGFARSSTADLRAAAARYPDDPGLRRLVADMMAVSPLFTRLWDEHRVDTRLANTKTFRHPIVGELTLHCNVLLVPDRDQRVVLYTAVPGTPSADALRLLRVVGTQDLTSEARA